jgi:hypothetical protein
LQTSEKPKTISDTSGGNIRYAYNYGFTIAGNDFLTIKFSNNRAGVTATLRIVTQSAFDTRLAGNLSSSGLTGLNFVYCVPQYPSTPSSTCDTANSETITSNGNYIIEFGGGASGDYVSYTPGSYVVFVYGTNSSVGGVQFDIEIYKGIAGRQFANIIMYIGWGLIIGFMGIAIAVLIKKTVEGRV